MGVQIITTPAGEEMVVMSRAEYDALIEDAAEAYEDGADVATYKAALANMAPEDVLPPSVSAAILAGSGRVRALREWRGYSVENLAEAAGTESLAVEQVEAGHRLLDRDLAARLSEALDIPTSWLAV